MISFDEFKKAELKIGKVLNAERVAGSEKLLKLSVDVGDKNAANMPTIRQVIAGVGKIYSPEEMINREIVVVANLEPRQLMGLESQGMLLAASTTDGPVLLRTEKEVPPGSSVG